MASFIKGLELDKENLNRKLIVVREEPGGEGAFCVSCLAWQCLISPDNGLLLCTTHRTFNHYYHVGMKLGYNLNTQSQRAVVVELGKAITGDSDNTAFQHMTNCTEESLKLLFIGIREKLNDLKARHRLVYLLFDNVSSLLFVGYTSSQLKNFLHYLRTLVDDNVVMVVSTQTSLEDEDQMDVADFLWHLADVRLSVAPLRTGSSQAVSGSLELTKKDLSKVESWTKPVLYHYKLSERNVKIFLPGNI